MKKRLRIILPLLLVAILAVVLYNYLRDKDHQLHLRLSGNIEATEAQLSFRIPGKLLERLGEEGDTVRAGQVLARLDNGDPTLAVTMAEAGLAHAQAVLAELVAGSRPEDLDRAQARVAQARESLSELERGNRSEDIERGRAELAAANAVEIKLLEKYLPQGLDEAKLAAIIDEAIRETGAASPKEMGKVMGVLKPHPDAALIDFGAVSKLIQAKLP